MEKTVEKTDSEEKSEESEDRETIISSRSTFDSDKVPRWESLRERYNNLWRTRVRDSGFIKGSATALSTAALFSALFALLATPFHIVGMMLYFYLGTIVGSLIGGYRYNLDGFGAFHIGLFSALAPISLIFFLTLFVNPIGAVISIPLLVLNILVMGFCTTVYSEIGQDVKERRD